MSDIDPLDERERMEPEREPAPRVNRVGVYDTGADDAEHNTPPNDRVMNPVNAYEREDTGAGGFNIWGLLAAVIVLILLVFLLVQFVF